MRVLSIPPRVGSVAEPGCTDAATLLCANHLVDQYGVDNLEIGSMIGWAMELYDYGILTSKDTDGVDLRFGNGEAVLEMIHRICQRKTWLGEALAEGPIRAAQKIGRDSEKYLVHVKGMSNLHSDERATPGLALNIAVSSRGSDHLRSQACNRPLPPAAGCVEKNLQQARCPYEGPLSSDHRSYEGKPWQVFWQENCFMGVDCMGICKYHTTFLGATLPNFEDWARVVQLQYRPGALSSRYLDSSRTVQHDREIGQYTGRFQEGRPAQGRRAR